MAISKKEAKRVAAGLLSRAFVPSTLDIMLKETENKSFRKSIKKIRKAVEQAKKPAAKKAA
jgi:hypothetical protein